MKHYKRANIYKANNVTFNPETISAYSYDWWEFVAVIGGRVVFNNYRYSSITGGHQSKVRGLLNELGIEINVTLECPKGLQAPNWAESCIEHYEFLINELKDLINKPRSQKRKNAERLVEIRELEYKIGAVNELELKHKKAV